MSKTSLTPRDKLKVAFGHLIQGIPQQDLAMQYEVNLGRVNEAVRLVGSALGLTDAGYKTKNGPASVDTPEV